MKARRLIEDSAYYAPETVRLMSQALDESWKLIAQEFNPADKRAVEVARVRLAHAILAATTDESRDVQQIKDMALKMIAMAYGGQLV